MNRFIATSLSAFACVVLVLAPTQSGAAEPSIALDPAQQFERADNDGDKELSWEEYYNYCVLLFHEWDTNGDGMILNDEHAPAHDAQGRGVKPPPVSLEAFTVELRKAFVAADKDQSGKLSYAEASGT